MDISRDTSDGYDISYPHACPSLWTYHGSLDTFRYVQAFMHGHLREHILEDIYGYIHGYLPRYILGDIHGGIHGKSGCLFRTLEN